MRFDRERNTFLRYAKNPSSREQPPKNSVQILFEDSEGEIWVGTRSGFTHFPTKQPPFVNYEHEAGNPNSLYDNTIWAVQADSKGFLWIGTDKGLNRLDPATGQFTLYQHNPKDGWQPLLRQGIRHPRGPFGHALVWHLWRRTQPI